MKSLANNFRVMKKMVYKEMLRRDRKKYKKFIFFLRAFKYASLSPLRGKFLEAYYVLMRYIDDIADGDIDLPADFTSSVEFMAEKIKFLEDLANPKDHIDYLILYCFDLAEKFKGNFIEETHDILAALLFDAKRRGQGIIFPESNLAEHFDLLDIKGTVKGTLKVFREDSKKWVFLEALGKAARIHYTLRDYEEDIKAGIINISREDCSRLKIDSSGLEPNMPGVRAWFKEQAEKGMKLLEEHDESLALGYFKLLTKLTLKIVYYNPAKEFFERIVANLK